jgi:hypothetical protein
MNVTDYTALPYGLLSHKTVHGVDVFWYETSLLLYVTAVRS